ncbi:MAG: ribosome biogenesis GTPase Der [Spirochaetes bacterium GWD1_61_31]|nr:MAG: ribosome biogenesis GTPase Der [Spirochaetes bacterium GWB1_60_80]OHD29093.1 MAG: ribosome biogenesis GTPase Der [Spirochaetes bacterium GWC1_61_12]OHD43135.1 MAG: ribosome biogenesis GTPase Der [Spirochaetes bacterium GWD1_61_31]OHD44272.1 MAG: ribosome biogenesis GTPase Der [Spirochaetes bacterium GWE1_60_18]OHD60445.1 MAG: ribosome biogenesis GTPase Der [Spirochaetes bacterium GWF1_60_12]HAP43296.1 ribosome biogenesis GTPase Der [Spirochaetaceae bacterium]
MNLETPNRWQNLPVVAVAGRPNVGKSTLFNRLLHRRRAIVDPTPGVTRDPIDAQWQPDCCDLPVMLVDTGGLKLERDSMDDLVAGKSWERIEAADLVLFLVDAVNITPEDEEFARQLRKYSAKLVLVVNKADGPERDAAAWSHAGWGYKDMVFVSAEHGRNIGELEELIVSRLDWSKVESAVDEHVDIRIAIMGKPNVGKSTLLNKLLGEEKSIVCDMPGTTRDVVEGHFERKGRPFTVLDTAGIRRKGKVTENVEYYSVNRAIKTLDRADVVILMIDAVEGLSEQDKKIVKLATDKGRAVVFTLNKWDKMPDVKNTFEASRDKLRFFFGQMAYAPVLQLAARDGVGLDKLLNMCVALFDELNRRIETSRLNKAVHEWVEQNPPPASTAGRFKLRYAVQTAVNPVSFSFFITKPDAIAETYISFLKNKLRSELGFAHIPLDLQIKASRKRFEDLEKKD